MRPTVPEQLLGLRTVIEEVVAPHVTDPYAADVLDGALAALETIGESWSAIPAFLRWDSAATAEVLALVGVAAPPPPHDPLDLDALESHQREVRGLLEASMSSVLADGDARRATVALFRERAGRYPLAARPRGGFAAHPAR
jgi:hypothetical protein